MTETKPAELIFICFMLVHGFVEALNCTSPTPKSLINALEKDLFPNKMVRPVNSFSDPMNVAVTITVVGIAGVDEKSQTLTTVIWRVLEWDIEGLSWDEKECGATRVSILRENLWIPDIHISEFMDEEESPETPYVYLYNTGHVFDDKPLRVITACKLVIYTFPFDIQNCSMTFGSYLHFASDIRVSNNTAAEDILMESKAVLETSGEWELADITLSSSNLVITTGSYSELKYNLILRRRPVLYVVNLLIPSCFLITVDLFSFMLPPQSVDRSSFKMTLILGYTVFLLIMNDLLPITGETTPLMNVFFSVSLALMVASLLETVFITKIQFSSSHFSAVPHWLSVLVLRYLAVIVCLPSKKKSAPITVYLNPSTREPPMNSNVINTSVSHIHSPSGGTRSVKPSEEPLLDELRKLTKHLTAIRLQVDKHFRGSKTSQEWHMIGIVIDRLLFGLYLVFIIVSFITIVSIWIWSSSYKV